MAPRATRCAQSGRPHTRLHHELGDAPASKGDSKTVRRVTRKVSAGWMAQLARHWAGVLGTQLEQVAARRVHRVRARPGLR